MITSCNCKALCFKTRKKEKQLPRVLFLLFVFFCTCSLLKFIYLLTLRCRKGGKDSILCHILELQCET